MYHEDIAHHSHRKANPMKDPSLIIDAEIIEVEYTMTEADARTLTDRIRVDIQSAFDLTTQAFEQRAWVALGYESWAAYCEAEFGDNRPRLSKDARDEFILSLRESGMSVRSIASATGDSVGTVHSAIKRSEVNTTEVTGTNGKTYKATAPGMTDDDLAALNGAVDVSNIDFDEEDDGGELPDAGIEWKDGGHVPDTVLDELRRERVKKADPEPKKARRDPITRTMSHAQSALDTATGLLTDIVADDRFDANRAKLAAAAQADIETAITTLTTILDKLKEAR